MRDEIAKDGFAVVKNLISMPAVESLQDALAAATAGSRPYGSRNLLRESAAVRSSAYSSAFLRHIEPTLGGEVIATRAVLFDKLPSANWGVGWHQDLTIALAGRAEVPGFSAWTWKDGVAHAQPPVHVLEQMLFLRLHLDDAGADNGSLVVLPGSHHLGRLPETEIADVVAASIPVVCEARAGDALLLRPLLLHMSRPSRRPSHRRVIQIEYAGTSLPEPLAWHEQREFSAGVTAA